MILKKILNNLNCCFHAYFTSSFLNNFIFHLASPYGKTKRIRWSKKEKETTLQAFSEYMEKLKLPSLQDIQKIKKKYTLLARRTSAQIKT